MDLNNNNQQTTVIIDVSFSDDIEIVELLDFFSQKQHLKK